MTKKLLVASTAILASSLLTACGTQISSSVKSPGPVPHALVGMHKTIAVLPLADYSEDFRAETAMRRNMNAMQAVTNELTARGFTVPVQEDVNAFLVRSGVITSNGSATEKSSAMLKTIRSGELSREMQAELLTTKHQHESYGSAPTAGTSTRQLGVNELKKIGREFKADYVLRGQIIEYKLRSSDTWEPMKKGLLTFSIQAPSTLLFGSAQREQYDTFPSVISGGTNILFGTADADASYVSWGEGGSSSGSAYRPGKIPMADVKLRLYMQDTATGNVVWTNNVEVRVEPATSFADQQYDQLFSSAVEHGISDLMEDLENRLVARGY